MIFGVLGQIKGIQTDPALDVATVDLATSWMTLKVRWWVDTERDPAYTVTAEVLTAIKKAFDASGIDMQFETQVNLFHNQTEEGGT